MEGSIDIKYPSGQMQVNLEKFFPVSQGGLKKLLTVIEMDWSHEDEIKQDIALWMVEEISQCGHRAKEYANKYMDAKTEAYEAELKVRRMKEYLDSVAAWKRTPEYKKFKEKFKVVEKEYRTLKSLESSHNSSFKRYQSRKERLLKNLDLIRGA